MLPVATIVRDVYVLHVGRGNSCHWSVSGGDGVKETASWREETHTETARVISFIKHMYSTL